MNIRICIAFAILACVILYQQTQLWKRQAEMIKTCQKAEFTMTSRLTGP